MFYKKSFFFKFRNIHRNTPVLESLSNEQHVRCFPMNVTKLFKNTYFEEHLRTDLRVRRIMIQIEGKDSIARGLHNSTTQQILLWNYQPKNLMTMWRNLSITKSVTDEKYMTNRMQKQWNDKKSKLDNSRKNSWSLPLLKIITTSS